MSIEYNVIKINVKRCAGVCSYPICRDCRGKTKVMYNIIPVEFIDSNSNNFILCSRCYKQFI
jgi:hypothetical protein